MSDFSFSATASCSTCGAYLSSSDEDCDHGGVPVETHVFRRLYGGRDSLQGVECTIQYKWEKLEEKVGDDWIAYHYLGTKDTVNRLLHGRWSGISELPIQSIATER